MPSPRKPGEPTTLMSSGDLGARVKILLADDSLTMHRAVTLGLRNEPYELIACDNGQDALRLALEHRPKIVLADLDMPGLTGIELLKKIREQKTLGDTKVVLLCSTFDDVDEARINEASADGRLWKPFESHALLALIKTLATPPPAKTPSPDATAAVLRTSSAPTQGMSSTREVTSPKLTPQTAAKAPVAAAPKAQAPVAKPKMREEPDLSATAEIDSVTQSGVGSKGYSIADALEEQGVPEETGPLRTDDIRQNLWSSDFESTPESSASVFASDEPLEIPDEGSEIPAGSDDTNFEIVTSSFQMEPGDELPPSISISMAEEETSDSLRPSAAPAEPPPLPQEDEMFRPEGWSQDLDFSNFQSESLGTRSGAGTAAAAPNGPNEAQIRAWIREEIREAFDSWLKKNLEDQLNQVLEELDESSP